MLHEFLEFFKPQNKLYIRRVETSFFGDEDDKKQFPIEKCVTSKGKLKNKFVP